MSFLPAIKSRATFAAFLMIFSFFYNKTDKIIQIPVDDLLNIRPVATLTHDVITPWTKGVDHGNGYLTMAAALFNSETNPQALPDKPVFAATPSHPQIILHYKNAEDKKNQARCVPDTVEFEIKVPKHQYSGLFISLTSAYGNSSLQFELNYKDGSEHKNFIVPDWWKDLKDKDPDLSYVAHNLGKWAQNNKLSEKDHHNIDALNIHPDSGRVLTSVKLKKLSGGYLVFWGATGVIK